MLWEELLEDQTYFEWGVSTAKRLYDIDLIEKFAKKLDKFSCENKNASRMFSAARDGALTVLDMAVTGELKEIPICKLF